ncbi:MAG: HAMP domain-containing protein [Chlorobiaceae bacterium]|nr:HAMP domain-containing protein [Chlorobiaceae bacterium]
MISLRHKLALGFGSLLAVIAVMALLTVQQIDRLGNAVDDILKQNYRSVTASQSMKEALEKMDSDILFSFTGRHEASLHNISESERKFREALSVELGNITLPGEKEKAERISELFDRYSMAMHSIMDGSVTPQKRRETYFTTLLPLLTEIGMLAQQILDMNQANMDKANEAARVMASSAHNRILVAIIACAAVTIIFSYQSRRWILNPIRRLINSANEIRNGNLELVIEQESNDEIGQLSEAFNEMAATLRNARRRDDENLYRTRRATQEVMNILPTPIAIFDREGRVEVATQSAARIFGLKPGTGAGCLDYPWLPGLLQRAAIDGRAVESGENGYIQKFIDNREYFFMPAAVPIPPLPDADGSTGTVLLLYDMTQVHEQKELKRDVVATVSHQLRTPLTSMRMAIHLLLEQRIGPLNDKQRELLRAAGEESDRLADILDDLLDLNRIESGRGRLKRQQCQPEALISAGIEHFIPEAKAKGIGLIVDVPSELPTVTADTASIGYVFTNLLSNALRYSHEGGRITVRAEAELSGIRFSVEDTGEGIPPEHLKRIFDQFYRVPGQDEKSGIGLGLSIVREIVKAHGGTVGVESTRGKGSVFHFTLPA